MVARVGFLIVAAVLAGRTWLREEQKNLISDAERLAQVRAEVMKPRLTEAEAKVVLETPPTEVFWLQDSTGTRTHVHTWRMPEGYVVRIFIDEFKSKLEPERLRVVRVMPVK
jgi:hypothetical protein